MTNKEIKKAFNEEVATIAKQIANADNLGMFIGHQLEKQYMEFQMALNQCYDIIAKFADKHRIYIE